MDRIDIFVKDIYSQLFYNGTFINPTRFFFLSALFKGNNLKKNYSRKEIEYLIYNYYIDNKKIAIRHPRIEIRNLSRYGIGVIKQELSAALSIWEKEAKSKFITFDSVQIFLDIEDRDYSAEVCYLKVVLEELFKKTYNISFNEICLSEGSDENIEEFGSGTYKRHLSADVQYCVCCDEYDLKKLVAIHILPDKFSLDVNSREDINNGLIMCREHAQEYLYGRFYFDVDGKIINVSSCLIQRNMRLGLGLMNESRKKYLLEYLLKKQN